MPRLPAQVRSVEPGVRRETTSTGVDGWFTIMDTRADPPCDLDSAASPA